jgi:hypothetical protein
MLALGGGPETMLRKMPLREAVINFSRNPKSVESELPARFVQNVDSSSLLMQQDDDIIAS